MNKMWCCSCTFGHQCHFIYFCTFHLDPFCGHGEVTSKGGGGGGAYPTCVWTKAKASTTLDESLANCKVPCKHLGVRYLAQEYLGIVLKVSWHLPCYQNAFHPTVTFNCSKTYKCSLGPKVFWLRIIMWDIDPKNRIEFICTSKMYSNVF